MVKLIFLKTFFVIVLGLWPCFTLADDFKYLLISFLGKDIGTIKIREVTSTDGRVIHINGKILSSPFKVFNGQFEYTTIITELNKAASRIHYKSSVDATFKREG